MRFKPRSFAAACVAALVPLGLATGVAQACTRLVYLGANDQVVRYAEVAGATVAWSAVGSGPPLIVGGWWCSHLELNFAAAV